MNETIEKIEVGNRILLTLVVAFVGIGFGLTIWFGFYANSHDWFHNKDRSETQEARAAEWVGEKTPPTKPLVVTIHSSGCVKIERARVDNDQFTVLFRRICGKPTSYSEFHWRLKANSTVIKTWYTNHYFNEMEPGEEFEWQAPDFLNFTVDPRATEIVLETLDK